MKGTIEIEYRSLITEEDFLRIRNFLNDRAENLGEDNKDTFFYIWADKVIKVVQNTSSGKTKMVLKPGRIHTHAHFDEMELTIVPEEMDRAKQFCEGLVPEKIMYAYQFRTNYKYQGVEIALKYTESYGFHLEFEIMVDTLDKKEEARLAIEKVADELGAKIMTDEELAVLVKELEGGQMYGKYTKESFPF